MKNAFRTFSQSSAELFGSSGAFLSAIAFLVVWAASGPVFDYSDTWQLIANTVTNVVTFVMVFIIQSTQNREAKATQLKLDELLRAVEGARTGLVNLEALSDEDLAQLQSEFERLQSAEAKRKRQAATNDDARK